MGRTNAVARPRYYVPAVERAVAVLELLAESRDGRSLSSIARDLGIPKSSCLMILSTLESLGYASREGRDAWSLTLRMYHVGTKRARNLDLLILAEPVLERLRDATGLTAHLGVPERHGALYALKVDAPGLVRFDTYPGKPASLHLTAIGRVIAAHMSPAERAACLASYRFEGGTAKAIRSQDAFEEQLREVRADGYALEDEEEVAGVRCIAAPVVDERGRVVAAVGIAGLTAQIDNRSVSELSLCTISAAQSISEALGAQGT